MIAFKWGTVWRFFLKSHQNYQESKSYSKNDLFYQVNLKSQNTVGTKVIRMKIWNSHFFGLWQSLDRDKHIGIIFFILDQFWSSKMTPKVRHFVVRCLKNAHLLCKKGLFQAQFLGVAHPSTLMTHISKRPHFIGAYRDKSLIQQIWTI